MNKLCFPPALFVVRGAGRCAEGGISGGGVTTSAGDSCAELENPLVNPSAND